jgi:hypothetical protein
MNLEDNLRRPSFQSRFDAGGVSVPSHIGERFLEDAENRRRTLPIQDNRIARQRETASCTSAGLEFLGLPFESRRKA